MKPTGSSNIQLKTLINDLKHLSTEKKVRIWGAVAKDLSKPTRIRAQVNLDKIDGIIRNDEIAIVPGKVLAVGSLSKNITIAAWNFSDNAIEKINKSGKAVSIYELMKENPKGSKVRIIA